MTTIADASPISEDTEALAIYHDLMSEAPSNRYDLARAGKYGRQLQLLMNARSKDLATATRTIESILARPNSELAQLLIKQRSTSSTQNNSIPPLPDEARLPEGFLPQPTADTKADWSCTWDSSRLRKVSPWLTDYIISSRQSSPEGFIDFHIACGLWDLATVAGRRIYVALAKRIYTPMAIALVARSSLYAKSTTADFGVKVLNKAGLGWLLGDDETTPQKLLADMSGHIPGNYEEMDPERQRETELRIAMSGQIGWYYDEFNQLIDAMTRPGPMAEFAGLLRKLDNCPDTYKYSTRSHGQEVIYQPYLSLLASTTPTNLRKHASKGAGFWNDGFWARLAFITPPPDAWRTETMHVGEIPIPSSLIFPLRAWSDRLGVPTCTIEQIIDDKEKKTGRYKAVRDPLPSHEVSIDDDAYQAYERYRIGTRSLIGNGANEDLDSSYNRLPEKALRIATLIASLENNNRIDIIIWTLAQEIAEMFRRNLHELYSQVTIMQDEDNTLEDALLEYLKAQNGKAVTVRDILQFGPNKIRKTKAAGVRDLLANLLSNGMIECKKVEERECYTLID